MASEQPAVDLVNPLYRLSLSHRDGQIAARLTHEETGEVWVDAPYHYSLLMETPEGVLDCRRLRDGTVTRAIACKGLEREGVDAAGLDGMDRKILNAIAAHHGLPVGVKTLAVMVGEEEDTVEDVYEPFLIQEGYILKTPRGRILAPKGYGHLGLQAPKTGPQGTQEEPAALF